MEYPGVYGLYVVLIVIGGTLFTHKVGKRILRLMWKNNVAKRHFELILCS